MAACRRAASGARAVSTTWTSGVPSGASQCSGPFAMSPSAAARAAIPCRNSQAKVSRASGGTPRACEAGEGERDAHPGVAQRARGVGGRGHHGAYAPHQLPAVRAVVDAEQDVGGRVRGRPGAEDPALDVVELEQAGSCTHRSPLLPAAVIRRGDVLPEGAQALIAAEQRTEDRGVGHQYVAGAFPGGRHPQERVELGVAGLGEGVRRPGEVDRLPGQDADDVRFVGRHRVVRQVRVEVEGGHPVQPPPGVQVPVDRQRSDLSWTPARRAAARNGSPPALPARSSGRGRRRRSVAGGAPGRPRDGGTRRRARPDPARLPRRGAVPAPGRCPPGPGSAEAPRSPRARPPAR